MRSGVSSERLLESWHDEETDMKALGWVLKIIFILMLVSCGVGYFLGAKAHAATDYRHVVVVESHVNMDNWPLAYGVKFVDQYTGKKWAIGKCNGIAGCVKVYATDSPNCSNAPGWTVYGKRTYASPHRIYLCKKYNHASLSLKKHLVVHELGHSTGLGHQQRGCTTVMCGTSQMYSIPIRFGIDQINYMRKYA